MNISRNKIILLVGVLVVAVVVVAFLSKDKKQEPQQTQTPEIKYDLYSRTGKIKTVTPDSGNIVVTIAFSRIKGGVAMPTFEDRTIKIGPQTEYFDGGMKQVTRAALQVGKNVTVYTADNIETLDTVLATKIDIN